LIWTNFEGGPSWEVCEQMWSVVDSFTYLWCICAYRWKAILLSQCTHYTHARTHKHTHKHTCSSRQAKQLFHLLLRWRLQVPSFCTHANTWMV
jgi:hypothetical protein